NFLSLKRKRLKGRLTFEFPESSDASGNTVWRTFSIGKNLTSRIIVGKSIVKLLILRIFKVSFELRKVMLSGNNFLPTNSSFIVSDVNSNSLRDGRLSKNSRLSVYSTRKNLYSNFLRNGMTG